MKLFTQSQVKTLAILLLLPIMFLGVIIAIVKIIFQVGYKSGIKWLAKADE